MKKLMLPLVVGLVACTQAVVAWSGSSSSDTSTDQTVQVTYNSVPVQVATSQVRTGQTTRSFNLYNASFLTQTVAGPQGAIQVIATMPSVFTDNGRNEMQQLSAFAKKWPDVKFYTVSQDIPFALSYWMKQTNWRNVTVLSNFRNNNFGQYFGTVVTQSKQNIYTGLNTNAVFVIGPNGQMFYSQYTPEISNSYNYTALGSAISKASSTHWNS